MTNYIRFPVLIPLIVCIACVVELGLAYTYPPSAARFPILIGYLTLALALWEFIVQLFQARKLSFTKQNVPGGVSRLPVHVKSDGAQSEAESVQKQKSGSVPLGSGFWVVTLGMVVYRVIIPWLGFNVSTFLFVLIISRLLGLRKWWLSVVIAVGTVVFLYGVFDRLLGIPFPEGTLISIGG